MMTPEQQAAHEAALTSAAQAVWSSKNFSEKDQGQTLADRPDGIRTRYTQDAATAVTEYQRHMAADVRAAVDLFEFCKMDRMVSDPNEIELADKTLNASRDALLNLLGAENTTPNARNEIVGMFCALLELLGVGEGE